MKAPWDGATVGLRDAIWRLHKCEDRRPTAADAPPLSVLPMTRAAREAVRLSRLPAVSPERRRHLTYGKELA